MAIEVVLRENVDELNENCKNILMFELESLSVKQRIEQGGRNSEATRFILRGGRGGYGVSSGGVRGRGGG